MTALETDVSSHRETYAGKRDLVCGLLEPSFKFVRPSGGFYVFAEIPDRFGSATEFCEAAAEQNVLVIPGNIFSGRDTHFRISYATSDEMIQRGCEVLCRMASSD